MSRLERSYRRLLRLYPRRYRAGREEEMLAVLLDASPAGAERASLRDAADLALGAVRVRAVDLGQRLRRRPAVAAGAGALLLGLLVALLPADEPAPAVPEALPSAFAGYSSLTADATGSPPGPAVALYGQGTGAELFDVPQTVVVGASGAYRLLEDGGLLSPDGTAVASGESFGDGDPTPEVTVRDLTSGEVTSHPISGGAFAGPMAWAPDSRHVAVMVTRSPLNDCFVPPEHAGGIDQTGEVVVLDAVTGRTAPVSTSLTPSQPSVAAFDPDGSHLAVQDVSGELVLVELSTGASRSLGHPGHLMAGNTAWSPDGSLLATVQPLPFVADSRQCDADGGPHGHHSFVGWTGPCSAAVLVGVTADGDDADPARLVEVDLTNGTRTSLSAIPTGDANYQVGGLQVARTALLSGVVREPPPTDRGRWPPLLEVVAASAFAGGAAAAASAAARTSAHHRRRRALSAGSPSSADGT